MPELKPSRMAAADLAEGGSTSGLLLTRTTTNGLPVWASASEQGDLTALQLESSRALCLTDEIQVIAHDSHNDIGGLGGGDGSRDARDHRPLRSSSQARR